MRTFIMLLFAAIAVTTEATGAWTLLSPGLELGSFAVNKTSPAGNSRITIIRIDPNRWELVLTGSSWDDKPGNKTAREWCEAHGFTAAINAGMFATDYSTHVGYMASKGHVNSSHVNHYQSVAAFHPKKEKGLPAFRIFDLDDPGVTTDSILNDYTSVVQNLRLIKRPGENRWRRQNKKWSEAALGEDRSGRVLFIFTRSPFTMHDFNRELLALGIGVVAAQHLEGGPQAQFYLHIGNVRREMFGSYETTFREHDEKAVPWPIPNILGVRPKP